MVDVNNKKEWYDNKELFELFNGIKDDFHSLRTEMKETRALMHQYNGLRDEVNSTRTEIDQTRRKIDDLQTQVSNIHAENQGKTKVKKGIRQWGGWVVGLISLLFVIAEFVIGL